MDILDLLDGSDDSDINEMMDHFDTEGHTEDSVIESIIRDAWETIPGETHTKSVAEEPEPEDPQVAKKPKGKRVTYSVACTLHLSGSDYAVQLLPASTDYDKAYRLNKIGAQKPTGYNIVQIDGEILCECPDYKFNHEGSDSKGCKHIRGLVDMGMFASPSISHRTGSGIFDG